ncbi:hypothetical protein SAMN05892883_2073 [Jatrophihabitans sp. GAS493]|uniref:hypothetical protein n=1 Tax=Jatrophihabitans sp. GAS493 TaxID=1907575 RepID=UPI000BB7339C|nr:hypothetical protein [Jatrophihabitans sp. GAS493]SOD72723.1 hypothetical protein SAMN05892883_2073 [Jatrophihabitans sp. GAS493]
MSVLDDFLRQALQVQTKTGDGARGPNYADPMAISFVVEDGRRMVRSANGDNVISETTLYTEPANAAACVAGSLVAVNGRVATVIIAKRHLVGDDDVDHLEVALT